MITSEERAQMRETNDSGPADEGYEMSVSPADVERLLDALDESGRLAAAARSARAASAQHADMCGDCAYNEHPRGDGTREGEGITCDEARRLAAVEGAAVDALLAACEA